MRCSRKSDAERSGEMGTKKNIKDVETRMTSYTRSRGAEKQNWKGRNNITALIREKGETVGGWLTSH